MEFEAWLNQITQSEWFIAIAAYLLANIGVILGLVIFAIKNKLRKDAAEIAIEEYKASLLKTTQEHEEVFVGNMDKRLGVLESRITNKLEEQAKAKKALAEQQAKEIMKDLSEVKKEQSVKNAALEISEVLKKGIK